jgi:arylsulfatase A
VSDEPVATIDFLPTALSMAGEGKTNSETRLSLDGKNILPFLLGVEKKSPNDLLLFFDGVYLQTVRAGRWKLHVARWNYPRYTASPGPQRNLVLVRPELYDLNVDAAESYDMAGDHQDIVNELKAKIAGALRSFPDDIQRANAELMGSLPPGR